MNNLVLKKCYLSLYKILYKIIIFQTTSSDSNKLTLAMFLTINTKNDMLAIRSKMCISRFSVHYEIFLFLKISLISSTLFTLDVETCFQT